MNKTETVLAEIKKNSLEFRKKILFMSYEAGHSSAHIGGALSSVEILATLYTKFLKFNKSIIEVPISYSGRSYEDGKKIKTSDGLKYLYSTLKYRYFD